MESDIWNLSTGKRRDEPHNRVKWPDNLHQQVLPPLILFAYFSHRDNIPETWQPVSSKWQLLYKPWRILHYPALRLIFRTGNRAPALTPPPPSLPFATTPQSLQNDPDSSVVATTNSLARWRADREFRACLWLHDIEMKRKGEETEFTMNAVGEVGWTPPPINSSDLIARSSNLREAYHPGKGYVDKRFPKVEFNENGARVKLEIGFRIDEWKAKIGSYAVFWHGVPFMRMTIDLEVHSRGNHRVIFNGSYIPTQIYQIGDGLPKIYDMVDDIDGYHRVEQALGVGFEVPAPVRPVDFDKYGGYIP